MTHGPRQPAPVADRPARLGRRVAVCAVLAMACGAVAGLFGPKMLAGGTVQATPPTADAARLATLAEAGPLGLTEQLGLSEDEIRAGEARWAALSAAERQELVDRYGRLRDLDAGDLEQLIEKYRWVRRLPADRQAALVARAARLAEIIRTLSLQDQAVLVRMSDAERASRLLALWQSREGA
jgi:hypothetical protein